ncbi:hypothetical protein [Rhizobium mongolense]|uniref:Uncharacterized protein n=1 Tax=Rhizobium mongolense TaxID=57676 RepID=A0A7W6WD45_9HYPH|nr:hypothetical protein [Rhizobium mongolense]MBB4273997.1 hypothetical protein [Rhizobium mongolense]
MPSFVGAADSRFPTVRLALGTKDLGLARMKRDTYERADDLLWASYCEGGDQVAAEARYKSAVARAKALGFTYRHLSSILAEENGVAVLSHLRAVQDVKPASPQGETHSRRYRPSTGLLGARIRYLCAGDRRQ